VAIGYDNAAPPSTLFHAAPLSTGSYFSPARVSFRGVLDSSEPNDIYPTSLRKGVRKALKILALPILPPPNPGTLADFTTKARKCDSQYFYDKSA